MLSGFEPKGLHRVWCIAILLLASFFLLPIANAEKRVALVIGNRGYVNAPAVRTAINDARAVAHALRRLDFDVIEAFDVDNTGMEASIRSFSSLLKNSDTGLFFYSGRGMQVGGRNYLVPVDAKIADASDLHFETIDLHTIVLLMEQLARTRLLFIDASHPPFFTKIIEQNAGDIPVNIGKGMAPVSSQVGTSVIFSSEPALVNIEHDDNKSAFTQAILKNIDTPGLTVEGLLLNIRNAVRRLTNNQQTPWFTETITGDLVLVPHNDELNSQETDEELKIQLDIRKRLANCEAHYAAFRLTDPVDQNALQCFREILAIDAENAEAHDGIRAIETNYVNWAEIALEEDNEKKIAQYVSKLRELNTGQARTQEILARVEERESEKQAKLVAKEAKRKADEDKRIAAKAAADKARQQALQAKQQLEMEQKRKAAAEADRRKAEEEAQQAAQLAEIKRAELEALRAAEKEARQKAEEEMRLATLAREKAEEEKQLAEEARKKAVEEVRLAELKRAELEALQAAEKEARQKAEEEMRLATLAREKAEEEKQLAEEARKKAAEEARLAELKRVELEVLRKAEEIARQKAEEEMRLAEQKRLEWEALNKAEEAARKRAEEETRLAEQKRIELETLRDTELAARKKAEELRQQALIEKRKEDEAAKRKAEQQRLQNELARKAAEEEEQRRALEARIEVEKKRLEQEDLARRLATENARREAEARRIQLEREKAEQELAEQKAAEETARQAVLERQRKTSISSALQEGETVFKVKLRNKEFSPAMLRLAQELENSAGVITQDQANTLYSEIIDEFKEERARIRRQRRQDDVRQSQERG